MKKPHSLPSPRVGISYTDQGQKERAEQLSSLLELPMMQNTAECDFILTCSPEKLSLRMTADGSPAGEVYAEFVKGRAGYRRKHGTKELLLKAIGYRTGRPLTVLDATGGMGRDSFLMASYGCTVHVLERNRIVAALLEDGLQRAAQHPDTCMIAGRVQLRMGDSLEFLQNVAISPKRYDVIYLDPMYPERSKSALVKKEMQMLQKLIGQEEDTESLFAAALAAAGKRVVVKRPKSAPPLTNSAPSHSLRGKTTRFDVYMIPADS